AQLKNIMQECKTVDDVYAFLEKRNLHMLNGSPLFHGAMLLFVVKTGKNLEVEVDTLITGKNNQFLLPNFSFADTKDLSTVKMQRYCNGVEFLKNKVPGNDIAFYTALSDTMSVHREKIGDGTLYTTIYDLENGTIYTYFFHDYDTCAVFRLEDELAKG